MSPLEPLAAWAVVSMGLLIYLVRRAWQDMEQRGRLLDTMTEYLKDRDAAEVRATLALEKAALHERRAAEFFRVIEQVEQEAQTWRRYYKTGMAGASAAQDWLVRDLSRVVVTGNRYAGRLRALGEKAPPLDISPDLKQALEQFKADGQQEVPHVPGTQLRDELEASVQRKLLHDAEVDEEKRGDVNVDATFQQEKRPGDKVDAASQQESRPGDQVDVASQQESRPGDKVDAASQQESRTGDKVDAASQQESRTGDKVDAAFQQENQSTEAQAVENSKNTGNGAD